MRIVARGKLIDIRHFEDDDAKRLHELSKHPDLNLYSGPYKASESIETAQEYIQQSNKEFDSKTAFTFAICQKDSIMIGCIGVFDISNKSGEIGFWLGRDYWGKGFTKEAVKLMSSFMLEQCGFDSITACFDSRNLAVGGILENAGYVRQSSPDKKEIHYKLTTFHLL